jgi:thiol-disulfide isomerase/thioredoxin
MATCLPRRAGIGSRAAIGLIAALAALLVMAAPSPTLAEDVSSDPVVITLFWGDGCPHCAAEKAFLDGLLERHPGVVVEAYEVWYAPANQTRFETMAAEHGIEVSGVPTTFVGDASWVGFTDAIGAEIEAAVIAELAGNTPSATAAPSPTASSSTVELPVFGEIDAAAGSLVATTALIALVDGFNPCSLWVLSVLLAMMLHAGSRGRLLAVGLTFLATAGIAYGLFMLGLFAVIDWIGFADWVRVAIAAVVGIFGIVAIKDYLWRGRGVSFSIPEERKPQITQRSRELALSQRSLLVLMPMTAFLAAGVALLELPCTAGFPVMWNGILADRGVVGAEFVALLGLYLAIYLLDELVLFGAAFATMRVTKMQEHHGRALKLVAGTVMLALSLVMLLAPGVLDSALGAIGVFAAALVLAGLLALVLPRPPAPAPQPTGSRGRRQRAERAIH